MKYKLGLDLGSTSLGWAVVELDENDNIIGLKDMGVRIFSDGQEHTQNGTVSLAEKRATARQMRNQTDRNRSRKRILLQELQRIGLLPTEKATLSQILCPQSGNDNEYNPYVLRNKAVSEQLSLYEIGRIFWHLSKHRGFSAKWDQDIDSDIEKRVQKETAQTEPKKETESEKEEKNVNAKIKTLRKTLKSCGCQTLGQYLYQRFKNNERTKFKSLGGDGKSSDLKGFPSRQLYMEEFDTIWNFQHKYYPDILNDENKKLLRDEIIYMQRPLKYQPVGKDKFTNTDRIAKCQPLYQEFRIIQDVNDLKINGEFLSPDYRYALYCMLNDPREIINSVDENGRISFDKIREHLNIAERFNLETNGRKGLLCNKTNLLMSDNSVFGDSWFNDFSDEKRSQIISEITAYYKTKDQIKKAFVELNITDDAFINSLIKLHSKLTKGYAEISAETINKVLPIMKEDGLLWSDAAIKVFGRHTTIRPYSVFGYNPPKQLPDYRTLFKESLTNGKIGNNTVHIALNQLRLVVNEIITKYKAHPYAISIEMARELKMGQEALTKFKIKQQQNQRFNEEARRRIREALNKNSDYVVTNAELERYKVWYNLNPKNESARFDWYDSKPGSNHKTISLRDALSPEYEIEHIIPRARGGDDTWANKILVSKQENLAKGDKIPFEYLTEPGRLDFAKERAKAADDARKTQKQIEKEQTLLKSGKPLPFNFYSFAWRFGADAMAHVNTGFKSRDLNDTRYLCKLARDYLSYICAGYTQGEKQRNPNVVASNGSMTDLFKSIWGINDCLPVDYDKWHVQKWQRDLMEIRIIDDIKSKEPDFMTYNKDKEETKQQQKLDSERIKAELDKKTPAEYLSVSSRKKDRSNHYHHALDAFAIACIDNGMVNKINSVADDIEKARDEWNKKHPEPSEQRTLQDIRKIYLKQNNIFSKPFETFDDTARQDLANRLANLTVSEKIAPDKLQLFLSGKNKGYDCLTADTAYGLVDNTIKIKSGQPMILVISNKKNAKKKIEPMSLNSLVPVFNKLQPNYKQLKAEYIAAFTEWRKNNTPENLEKLQNTITKDKVFKWLASAGNYATEIYTTGKTWKTDIMSKWWALQRKGVFWWRDKYPNGHVIMTLRRGDVVRVKHENIGDLINDKNIGYWVKQQQGNGRDLLLRVKELSKGKIYLTPIHVAQQDAKTKSWQASATSLQAAKAEAVNISALGDTITLK